jgi:L-alanine-DL-glutamate epimerase-like enolase superfamily enzyme
VFGLYGPIDREVAIVLTEELKPFVIGKDPLAGEKLWDQMYRSNRHSCAGIFLTAISAIDNALCDLRELPESKIVHGIPPWLGY